MSPPKNEKNTPLLTSWTLWEANAIKQKEADDKEVYQMVESIVQKDVFLLSNFSMNPLLLLSFEQAICNCQKVTLSRRLTFEEIKIAIKYFEELPGEIKKLQKRDEGSLFVPQDKSKRLESVRVDGKPGTLKLSTLEKCVKKIQGHLARMQRIKENETRKTDAEKAIIITPKPR